MTAKKSLGATLKKARTRAGLSQAAVARASGINPAYLSQIENDRRGDPQFETVARICAAIGLSLDDLRSGAIHPPDAISVPDQLRDIADRLRSLAQRIERGE